MEEIKTTTLTTPNSHKNKSISTFVNYDELEFESGEAFAKIKAKLKIKDSDSVYKGPIEIGHSIKTSLKKEKVDNIIKFIDFVKYVMTKKEINDIPLFNIVRDKKLIKDLEEELVTNVDYESDKVIISELEIIGTTEVFNTSDDVYEIKSGRNKPIVVNGVNNHDIIQYLKDNNLELNDNFLGVNVSRIVDGVVYDRKKVIEMIDYIDDKKMCVLLGGK